MWLTLIGLYHLVVKVVLLEVKIPVLTYSFQLIHRHGWVDFQSNTSNSSVQLTLL
jgi:hypothetical protein